MNNKIYNIFLGCGVLNDYPFPINDFDSLTQYEMLTKCISAIKKLYENDDVLSKKIDALAEYINNLDLQDEVNNKIDKMVESGELQEIITSYLQVNGVLGYDTLSNLVSATNIIDGSICRTLGLNTYNDGKGAFYKIRTITSDDNVDGVNIIALNISNTLIAEKMPDYYITNLQTQITANAHEIDLIKNRKFLFVGDSLATGYQGQGVPHITGYFELVTSNLNLNSTIVAQEGYGFLGQNKTHKWKDLIENANISNKDSYTDIIIMGGDNDGATPDLYTAIDDTITYLKTNFTNATIHIGKIGRQPFYTSDVSATNSRTVNRVYEQYATRNSCKYIKNSFLILHNTKYFISDNVHLNSNGENQVAYCLGQYILNGLIYDITDISSQGSDFQADTMEWDSNITPSTGFSIYSFIDENMVSIALNGMLSFVENPTIGYNTDMVIGKLTQSYLCGSAYKSGLCSMIRCCIVDSSDVYHDISVNIYNDYSNNIHLQFYTFQDATYLNNLTIKRIQFNNYQIRLYAMSKYC